jgi:hypothetical protein
VSGPSAPDDPPSIALSLRLSSSFRSRENCFRARFRLRSAFLWLAWATFIPLSGGARHGKASRSDLVFYRRPLVFAPGYRDLTTLDHIDRTRGRAGTNKTSSEAMWAVNLVLDLSRFSGLDLTSGGGRRKSGGDKKSGGRCLLMKRLFFDSTDSPGLSCVLI